MLTAADEPTIRNAIMKRIDKEPGVKIIDLRVMPANGAIGVAVEMTYQDALEIRSAFMLPPQFEHAHLLDEIDEITEQVKAARTHYWVSGRPERMPFTELTGTGLKGRWARYG